MRAVRQRLHISITFYKQIVDESTTNHQSSREEHQRHKVRSSMPSTGDCAKVRESLRGSQILRFADVSPGSSMASNETYMETRTETRNFLTFEFSYFRAGTRS